MELFPLQIEQSAEMDLENSSRTQRENEKKQRDDEIDYILDIADAMGIDAERVKEINAVVNEYLEVSQKACILLEQEHWT